MARVPHRRETRLDAHAVLRLVLELLQLVLGAHDLRMIVGIAQRLQRDERIEHRRENRGQTVAALEAFQHPFLAFLQRPFAAHARPSARMVRTAPGRCCWWTTSGRGTSGGVRCLSSGCSPTRSLAVTGRRSTTVSATRSTSSTSRPSTPEDTDAATREHDHVGWSALWRSSSSRCARCARRTATRSSSTTSPCISCRGRRSASSVPTGRASPPCCGSWPGSTSRPTATRRSAPATRWASSSRSRSSTRTRPCSATSRKASPRPRRCWSGSTRSPRRWRSTTPTRSSTRWAGCRSSSTTGRPGIWTRSSSRRWTRCGAHRATPTSVSCPAASAGGWPCAGCCCSSPTCSSSTSRPTTWTPRACSGSSSTWRSTRGVWWPSPTTGTSSTTSRSGSSSSTVAGPIRTRATTRPTWRPSRPGCGSRAPRTPSGPSG